MNNCFVGTKPQGHKAQKIEILMSFSFTAEQARSGA